MGESLTRGGRLIYAAGSMLLAGACATTNPTSEATETERALCDEWGQSLPSRSRSDTDWTRAEIGVAYDVFAAACPGYPITFRLVAPESLGPSAGGGV
jgi:hypothetical protein